MLISVTRMNANEHRPAFACWWHHQVHLTLSAPTIVTLEGHTQGSLLGVELKGNTGHTG
jgi:hypothetical protein